MTLIVLIAFLSLFTSFLCSLLEAALYSVSLPQLEVLRKRGVYGAARFARFRADVEVPIAAILTVNTVANTVGAAICAGLVVDHYGTDRVARDAALGVFSVVFTLLVLAGAEIVPKSIGVRYGKSLIPLLAWPLQLLIWISTPVARTCSYLMRKLIGRGGVHVPTEDEIIAMSRMAAKEGELTALERSWVENALHLDRVSAKDLLTPRTVVQSLQSDVTVGQLRARSAELIHSRIPITEGNDLDRIVGVAHRRDLFDAMTSGRTTTTLRELAHPIEFVPESMKGPDLLDKFIRGKRHMVVVIDEYGGVEGIVTLEDVLECLIGTEIVDEHDEHEDMQAYARSKARLSAVSSDRGDAAAGSSG